MTGTPSHQTTGARPIGWIWTQLLFDHHKAARAQDEEKRLRIFNLLEAIRAEFPENVAAQEQEYEG